MEIKKESIVTADLGNDNSSTFIVDTVEENSFLLTHPLAAGILIRVPASRVNKSNANIKDSLERGIDYANTNRKYLDYNTALDLEAVAIFFTLKRLLTPRQKQTLANICGVVASVKFHDDVNLAIQFVNKNSALLDEFNRMWYINFSNLFSGRHPISSKKQKIAIFNIAGYILAEIENPKINRHK